MLASYYDDLLQAEEKGWNLIMEKYARMMESTAWEQYQELKKDLPERSEKRLAIQEEIIKIQVGWMEEFAKRNIRSWLEMPEVFIHPKTVHITLPMKHICGANLEPIRADVIIIWKVYCRHCQSVWKSRSYDYGRNGSFVWVCVHGRSRTEKCRYGFKILDNCKCIEKDFKDVQMLIKRNYKGEYCHEYKKKCRKKS